MYTVGPRTSSPARGMKVRRGEVTRWYKSDQCDVYCTLQDVPLLQLLFRAPSIKQSLQLVFGFGLLKLLHNSL